MFSKIKFSHFLILAVSNSDQGPPVTGGSATKISLPAVLGIRTIQELIDRIINFLLIIGTSIFTGMVLWAAYQILTAGDNPENAAAGRRTIWHATIGYTILLLSKGIVLVIQKVLGGQ